MDCVVGVQVEELSGSIRHHIPLAVLFREHWAGVLLQFLLEACYGTAFYTFFTWQAPLSVPGAAWLRCLGSNAKNLV
jgi:hypothetical protein